jgi:hypothetical protein
MTLTARLFFWASALLTASGTALFLALVGRNPGLKGPLSFGWDIQKIFAVSFGFLVIWVGISGLLFGKVFAAALPAIRTASLYYAIAPAGIGAIAAAHGFLGLLLVVVPALVLYLGAFFAAPRHS